MTRFALMLTCLLAAGLGLRAQGAAPAPKRDSSRSQAAKEKTASARKQTRAKAKPVPDAKRLDLNSATKAQLEKLPGVTPAYADQIIAHRPYLTNEHLVINKVVPESVYFSIRDRVIARQPGAKPAPARKPSARPAK